jgi:hypothetical protein
MSSDFWTTKSYIPYQSHNFQVDFKLYAIKSDRFYQESPDDASSVLNTPDPTAKLTKGDVEEVVIPYHAVKSVDMPTLEAAVDDVSANLSAINETEARDPNYQDITITFYAADTEHGNIIDLLPRIFHAYYLNYNDDGQSIIPFLTQFDKDAPEPNQGYVGNSYINVNLFKGNLGKVANIEENPNGRDFRTESPGRTTKNKRSIVYRNILPVSYDIGNLSYEESGVIECTMVFKYNLQDGKFGVRAGNANTDTEVQDTPAQ